MMKLLLTEPTVLLLDEPSNDIDVETLEWLERLIQNWKHIVLFISHDETLIENTANMIIYIEQIRRKTVSRYTIAKMSYEQYRKERLRNFENQERQAESERREKKIREEKLCTGDDLKAEPGRRETVKKENARSKIHGAAF